MPTTDTFIIPPVNATPEPKSNTGKQKKRSEKGKWAILITLVILIISLPIGVYYFSQRQQVTETRSKATYTPPTTNQCSAGQTRCQTNADGTNTGYICKCVDANNVMAWSCGSRSDSCPTGTSNNSGSTAGTRTKADGTAGGCGYIQKPPLSGLKPCNEETCGMNCGVYTYDCGNLCFDKNCGSTGCGSGGGVGAKEPATNTPEPTATTEPTVAPTSAPAEPGKCDASCNTDSNCESGLSCSSVNGINRCRNSSCPAESGCSCSAAAAPTSAPVTNNTSTDVSGDAMPVSGTGPGVLGSLTVIGSVLLLIAGLAL